MKRLWYFLWSGCFHVWEEHAEKLRKIASDGNNRVNRPIAGEHHD